MHLTDALSVVENADSEWFHNVILNIFDVYLVDAPMPLLYDLIQLKSHLFPKVDTSVAS